MQAYKNHTSIAAALNRPNVDTDQIIPKQFLKKVERTGFGIHLFNDWRYRDDGTPNPDFELNEPEVQGAKILVADDNFGCGSSREHAPWAIADYGFNTIISTSFADIFYSNCFKNGILPIKVTAKQLACLFAILETHKGSRLQIDIQQQFIQLPNGERFEFTVDAFRKSCLMNGLDDIGWTLQYSQQISEFEKRQQAELPWLWPRA